MKKKLPFIFRHFGAQKGKLIHINPAKISEAQVILKMGTTASDYSTFGSSKKHIFFQ
jgi:hypothetical protein